MPSISRLPSGKYRVRWRDQAGKQCTSPAVGSKIEAAALSRQVEADLARSRSLDATIRAGRLLDLRAVITRYCETGLATGRIGKGRAFELTRILDLLLDDMEWKTTAAVTAEAVDRWRVKAAKEGRGENPIRYLLAVLRWASGAPLRQPVDTALFVLPSIPRPYRSPPDLLMAAQVAEVIALAKSKGGETGAAIIEHLATYGCRPVEVCRLLVRDFDPKAGTITHRKTKNGDPVTHPLMPRHLATYRRLTKDRDPDAPLFLSPSGEAWRLGQREQAAQLTGWYRDNCSIGLPTRQRGIYCLKDYAISRMESSGIDDRTKSLFTGHRTMAVFARYKTTNQTRAREALAQLKAVSL